MNLALHAAKLAAQTFAVYMVGAFVVVVVVCVADYMF